MNNVKKGYEIKKFTEGNLTSHLIKFAIPVLLSHLMMVLLNTVDMIVIGQKLGENGTSAVSIGGSVAMFLNAFIGGFSATAQVIIAMMVEAGKLKRVNGTIMRVGIISLTMSALLITVFLICPMSVLKL